ncbi:conserved hypothetical protein [Methanococcus aeolicus Nankai-3]|uniref:Uncharacterized protein n=1 Tax=Methanococcus aeolicus (strain ATCC BAA-1280 / DSM 17508 / OCM 812 / Nankai-3) TaxID=419665 RepID=A6UW50_META3|nr:hypothetical protein [Methanococcus aeolicus]ABR56722.1 conserved hypothetical protein [Methanococcus aeolicus Nankai-3]
MDIIDSVAKDFLTNDIWIMPTDREDILELDDIGNIKIVDTIPIIRTLATPSLKKTLKRLLYIIKDKMVLFDSTKNSEIQINIMNYINKKYFDAKNKNYYRAKKAWYRFIGDIFNNIEKNEIKKALTKIIVLLKVLNPILVFEVHNISKWNYPMGFKRFIDYLHTNGISIVIKCPVESKQNLSTLFENSKINDIAIVKYYAKLKGRFISTTVAKYLLNISNGNTNIIDILLLKSKRELKTLRDLKVPWLKILPIIVPSKYQKIINIICNIKKFKINDIEQLLDLKIPTIYAYLKELVDMGIITKRRINNRIGRPSRTFLYKLSINKEILFDYLDNLPYNDLYFTVFHNANSQILTRNNTELRKYSNSRFRVFGLG